MMCDTCADKNYCEPHRKNGELIVMCGAYKKLTTNADRIRAMSDEELAEFIGGIFTVERDVWGDYDPRLVVTQEPRVEVRNKEDMMDWLKSSADGGDGDG